MITRKLQLTAGRQHRSVSWIAVVVLWAFFLFFLFTLTALVTSPPFLFSDTISSDVLNFRRAIRACRLHAILRATEPQSKYRRLHVIKNKKIRSRLKSNHDLKMEEILEIDILTVSNLINFIYELIILHLL